MQNETMLEILQRYVSDGDTWIGVFENHDLGSQCVGMKFALCFPLGDGSYEKAKPHKTRAPDTRMGLGWRYLLIYKTTCPWRAQAILTGGKQYEEN